MNTNEKVYQIITDRIIEQLEKGVIPWRKTWKGSAGMPCNLITKKAYRGLNIFMLLSMGFGSRYFLTFSQVKKLGGHVKKGEHGTPVVFWNFKEYKKEDSEDAKVYTRAFCRYYKVFNSEQCEGLKVPEEEKLDVINFKPIKAAEKVVKNFKKCPAIVNNTQRAYYNPHEDTVNMPKHNSFESEENYYSVLFHELTHSTGHQDRLSRDFNGHMFGGADYSKEELVAEFGATFLTSHCGLEREETFKNSVAYIQGWSKKLRQDPKLIIHASGRAQKSSNYILNIKAEYETNGSSK